MMLTGQKQLPESDQVWHELAETSEVSLFRPTSNPPYVNSD